MSFSSTTTCSRGLEGEWNDGADSRPRRFSFWQDETRNVTRETWNEKRRNVERGTRNGKRGCGMGREGTQEMQDGRETQRGKAAPKRVRVLSKIKVEYGYE